MQSSYPPVQTGPGAQPVSYTMGTGSFPGVKRPRGGVDRPSLFAPRLKKEYSYIYSPSGSSWPVTGWALPLPLTVLYISSRISIQRTAPQGSPRTPATCIAATTPGLIVRILNSVFFLNNSVTLTSYRPTP